MENKTYENKLAYLQSNLESLTKQLFELDSIAQELNDVNTKNNTCPEEVEKNNAQLKGENQELHTLVGVLKEDIKNVEQNNTKLSKKLKETLQVLMEEKYKNRDLAKQLENSKNENKKNLREIAAKGLSESERFIVDLQKQEIYNLQNHINELYKLLESQNSAGTESKKTETNLKTWLLDCKHTIIPKSNYLEFYW